MEQEIFNYASSMQCQELHYVTEPVSGLQSIIAIHNTNLGPSLGGCRIFEYSNMRLAAIDAIRLAQGMSYKAALAKLPLGGGKAVIVKPQGEFQRAKVLQAFADNLNRLGGKYITAVDIGSTSEDMDLIQEVSPHVCCSNQGIFSVADPSPFTARGVLVGMQAAAKYSFDTEDLSGKHVLVQGLGHVGAELVAMLYQLGAKTTVFDIDQSKMYHCRNSFGSNMVTSFEEFISTKADIFAPCATGAILNQRTIPQLKVKLVAGAANNQLEVATDAKLLAKYGIAYAPDIVINVGGLVYVSGPYRKLSEQQMIGQINNLGFTVDEIFQRSANTGQTTDQVAITIARERINQAQNYV